ncbi:hypothetical protein BGW39_009532 [Mortierella sp. 14UC]|nr:hypothetical protein BGW39_009532 [Mortierella sp. 14UC]
MAGYHHHHQQQLLLQQQQQQQQQDHQQQLQLQLQQEQHLQEQQAFDQEMASHSEYDNSTHGYEWTQDHSSSALESNQLASALSLDMLLSLGSASGPSPSSSQSPGSPTMPNASHLPQQTYYELLMAANPNEPLSQLLSTSAASMTSTCFTATATSPIPTIVASSSSLPLDPYNSVSAVSSSSISTATAGSMAVVEASTAEQILTSVASAYSMAAFPLGPSSMEQQQLLQQQQQTVPLTTKEIMDALSGQFPIQPVMTSTVTEVAPPTVASVILSASTATVASNSVVDDGGASNLTDDSTVATGSSQDDKDSALVHEPVVQSNDFSTTVESGTVSDIATTATAPVSEEATPVINIGIRHDQQQDESWESDVDVLSPPSLVYAQDTDDESSSPTSILSSVTSPPAQVDLEMSEMTLTSPPLSPSRPSRMLKQSKSLAAVSSGQSVDSTSKMSTSQRRKSRRISRRCQAVSESSSFSARLDMSIESEEMESAEQQDEQQQQQQQVAAMPPKRRRPSDDDASESPCSSPESSPPSPRTPPPSSALPSLAEDMHHHHHLLHHDGAHTIVDQEMDPSKRLKVGEAQAGVEGEDAGVLSPLLLNRSPKRQSSRLLRRTSGRVTQSAHSAVDASSSSPGHALSPSPSRGKVSAA